MIYFYLSAAILGSVLLITDMVLRYMEKIKSFGMEKKLICFEFKTVPLEKLLPENLTMLFVFFICFGAAGLIVEAAADLRWYFSVPYGLTAAMLMCFCFQYPLRLYINKIKKHSLPLGDLAANTDGWTVEEIGADDGNYGLIEFEYNDIKFRAPAMSANNTFIPEFEKVIVLFEENGFYFVESIKEVYEPVSEDMTDGESGL